MEVWTIVMVANCSEFTEHRVVDTDEPPIDWHGNRPVWSHPGHGTGNVCPRGGECLGPAIADRAMVMNHAGSVTQRDPLAPAAPEINPRHRSLWLTREQPCEKWHIRANPSFILQRFSAVI